MMYKKGKPLLNKELVALEDGAVVWVVYKRDGRKKMNEPLRIWTTGRQGKYSPWYALNSLDRDYDPQFPGEHFESNYSIDPNEQAARDVHDGMFLFHAIEKE